MKKTDKENSTNSDSNYEATSLGAKADDQISVIVKKLQKEKMDYYETQNIFNSNRCFKKKKTNKNTNSNANFMSEKSKSIDIKNKDHKEEKDVSYSPLGEKVDEEFFINHDFVGRFKIGRSLGTGSSCRVRLGIDPKTGEKVAIKIIDRKTAYEDRVYREALIASLLCHPHIVPLRNFFFSKSFFYLVFEYVSGVQLLDLVLNQGPLSEKTARRFFRQIASAVSYIHSNCIVHRDLKIENILVDEHGSVKIIDFGLSNFFDKTRFLSTFCGSLYFAAPELLAGVRYVGPEIDVWSLGVVLYVLLHGRVPFDDPEISGLHSKITRAKFDISSSVSKEAKEMLSGMICKDILRRLSMRAINSGAWVNSGFSSRINDFVCERKPLTELDEQLLKILSAVSLRQFPNLKAEVQRYHTACVNMNEFEKDYYGKRPTVSLYYLMKEKIANSKVNVAETAEALSMHNFVSFVQDRSVTASRYFLGAVFNESRSEKAAILQRTTPILKKSMLSWIYKGISVNRIKCQYELREWTDKILAQYKIDYEVKERYYLCQKDDLNFKISLYRNTVFGSFFLTITRFDGCKKKFVEILKDIRSCCCTA